MSLNDEAFAEIMGSTDAIATADELEPESHCPGTVIKIHGENVFFSLGTRNEGTASLRQFDTPPELGAVLDVVIVRFDPTEGMYEVSVPGASATVNDWEDVSEGIVVEARITGHNSGGLECEVGHLRGFIPASQIALFHVENLEEFVDEKFQCVVTEANPQKRNLVLSRRAILEREREEAKKELWKKLEVGQIHEGTVKRLHDFGAFVDIGGVDGLIHVSQMSWERVNHPSEVLHEGQEVKVRIERINQESQRIGLSYRDLLENPWTDVASKYPVSTTVTGTITRLADFGAFVKLEPGIEGLIHVSELAHHRVQRVSNVVQEGQEVEVKIVSVDAEAQRIGLSLKDTMPNPKATKKDASPEDEIPDGTRKSAVPRRSEPLKGGVDRPSGGEGIGLNW